ncbi:MAG TPA: MBL fold metallo-hydrolase [Bryobacteraceae bacterium]|nr:MBL fold metallo-hydrolase [Bryobacteraceae bacterium]
MRASLSPRWIIAPVFLAALGWAFESTIPPIHPVLTTEEGQQVVFDRFTWQYRELAKRLDISEAWPAGQAIQDTLTRYGLIGDAPPEAIPVPARITSDIYLVGQDRVSNLTYMIDCGPDGVAIIDPTYASEFERTVANVEKCGRSRKDIRWVVNTHCHVDHAMADKQFRDLGAKIAVHEADAVAIEKGTRVTAYYLIKEDTGKVAPFPHCPIDLRLADGEELRLGNKVFEVIHTPGHTPGSACFLLRSDGKNVLFSGDTVLYDGRLGWQGNPYADNRQYLASLQKLNHFTLDAAKVQWDILLPGHGAISMDKAYLDVQKDLDLVTLLLGEGREIPSVPFSLPEYRKRMYGRAAVKMP